jgi:hypothetical protein
MKQLQELESELSTTAELKVDMCALGTGQQWLKGDIATFTEDKVDHRTNANTEGLKTELNYLRSEVIALESKINEGQAEIEGKWERQQMR